MAVGSNPRSSPMSILYRESSETEVAAACERRSSTASANPEDGPRLARKTGEALQSRCDDTRYVALMAGVCRESFRSP